MSQMAQLLSIDETHPIPPPGRRGGGRFAVWAFWFAMGSATGAMGAVIVINNQMDQKLRQPERWPRHMVESMRGELDLTEEQTAQVQEIVNQHHKAIGKIWADAGPRFRAELKTMEDQVAGVLSGEQQQRWHEWLETRRRRVCPNPGDATSQKRDSTGSNRSGDPKRPTSKE
ncbi:MAG TPA: hypothetical protein VND64_26770 [Pirellulales bacterium]|nr:hypothetical protein [Pirellulales bacterium]